MKSIRKFLQLSPVERRFILRTLRILPLIAWALRLLGFDRCKALLIRQVSRYSVMYADIILVASEGGIVESTTHSELLAPSGRYADSWAAQMEASR